MHSVLDRTPDYLLHEIILMDDFSSEGMLNNRIHLLQVSQIMQIVSCPLSVKMPFTSGHWFETNMRHKTTVGN